MLRTTCVALAACLAGSAAAQRPTRPGEFNYACLMPGHMESGMVSKVIVK